MSKYYLKPTIKLEPTIWKWYAWSHLISPITAACNIVERHLRIMESYLQNPQIHAQASKDPNLLGGPFIDLDGEYLDEIESLIKQTKLDCKDLITLEKSFKLFDKELKDACIGDSLENFYFKIPDPLNGLIELVYDINNNPSIRIIEPLVYEKYYDDLNQQIVLSDTREDYRKFVLSTPYIENTNKIFLNIPFSDSRIDKLFTAKIEPVEINELQELLKIPSEKAALFESFFTKMPTTLDDNRNYNGDGFRIRYLGHACILIQTKNVSILFDPVISYPIENGDPERFSFLDLPDVIDYVFITHNHQDHLMFETLLHLRHKIGSVVFPSNSIGFIADPSIKLILKHIGFSSLIELKELDFIDCGDITVMGIPFLGEHSDLNVQSKISYCINLFSKKILLLADSNNLHPPLYNNIFSYIGKIDILFIGMECDGAPLTWLYGPLLTDALERQYDNNRTLSGSNFDKAWDILTKSKAKEAYIYAMGQEAWLNYVMALQYNDNSIQIVESDKFIKKCRSEHIQSARLFGKKEWIYK